MSPTSATELTFAAAHLERIAAFDIRIPQPQELLAYLDRHPGITDVVEKAVVETEREFGGDAELTLELYRDPEIDDPYPTLYVRQAVYDKHIMARIDAVRARYRDALAEQSGWLHVTTDFRPSGRDHGV